MITIFSCNSEIECQKLFNFMNDNFYSTFCAILYMMIMKNFHVKFGNKQMQFYSLRFQIWLLFACQECTKIENYN